MNKYVFRIIYVLLGLLFIAIAIGIFNSPSSTEEVPKVTPTVTPTPSFVYNQQTGEVKPFIAPTPIVVKETHTESKTEVREVQSTQPTHTPTPTRPPLLPLQIPF